MDALLAEARSQGLTSVLWLTYRESGANAALYRSFNDQLRPRAAIEPDLRLLDWNSLSAGHPEWVSSADGLHLSGTGARAMADLIAAALAGTTGPETHSPAAGRGPMRAAELVGRTDDGSAARRRNGARRGRAPARLSGAHARHRDLPGKLGAGRWLEVPIVGRNGVPSGATR